MVVVVLPLFAVEEAMVLPRIPAVDLLERRVWLELLSMEPVLMEAVGSASIELASGRTKPTKGAALGGGIRCLSIAWLMAAFGSVGKRGGGAPLGGHESPGCDILG
jgi:hypothetical protein